MAALTVQQATDKGITLTYGNATSGAGDTFKNTGREFLHIKNGHTAAINVTITAQHKCNFGELHNEVINVPAGTQKVIGPFDVLQFNDSTQYVHVTYDVITNITVAVVRI